MAEVESIAFPSGYEYEFVSTVYDEYHCLICHLPLREPVLTRCGHRYCKKCLDEALRRQQVPQCPADRVPLDPEKDIFPDKATERNILSCHVRCPSEGCKWTGETRYVETHLQSCSCKIIPCPNSNCDMTMERRLVEDHVTNMCQWRMMHCGYCDEMHAKCDEGKHASECQRSPTDCSNGCGEVIPREEIGNHTENDCPLTLISCHYLPMGCKSKVQRDKMESHLKADTGLHLDLACVKLNDAQTQLSDTQVQLTDTQVQLRDTQVQLRDTQVQLRDTQVQLRDTQDKLNTTQLQLNITQAQINDTQETTRDLVKRVGAFQRQLNEKVNKKQVNKAAEDKVMQMKKRKSFTWKIDNFSEILSQAKTRVNIRIESDPFYTESCGYKLKVSLYPNGNGSAENTQLSVFIVVMKGEYDAILPWPFKKTVTFTLIDQQGNWIGFKQNVEYCFTHSIPSRPMNDDVSNSRGFKAFISHEKLNTRCYLVDDTLFLKVQVAPTT